MRNTVGVLAISIGALAFTVGVTGSMRWGLGTGGGFLVLLSVLLLIDIEGGE